MGAPCQRPGASHRDTRATYQCPGATYQRTSATHQPTDSPPFRGPATRVPNPIQYVLGSTPDRPGPVPHHRSDATGGRRLAAPVQPAMKSLQQALSEIEAHRKTLEIYSANDQSAIVDQFATRNVTVVTGSLPPGVDAEFVIVRGPEGEFVGSLGLDTFRAILSPAVHPPWVLTERETAYSEVFDFLDDTLFSSYDRRQMLATTREIEERAWRRGEGTLYVGFQNRRALEQQTNVYETLAAHGNLAAELYVSDEWDVAIGESVRVTSSSATEIGQFWFVLYDGGGSAIHRCGLVAEERDAGRYYGFWTYDPALVEELVGHLRTTYGPE